MKRFLTKETLLPHFVYFIVAIIVTLPAWTGSGGIVGGGDQPDWTGTAWVYWWAGKAVDLGLNPFDGTYNFFPIGQRPLAQYNLLDAFLALPLIQLFGVRLGYNLFALLITWSTAWGMHRLVRTAGTSMLPALFAGVALETSSFLLLELAHGRLSQAMLFFWLTGLVGLLQMARGKCTNLGTAITAIAIAATSLTYWYWGLFLIFAAIPLWVGEFWFWDRKRFYHLSAAAGIVLLICGPYVWALSQGYDALPGVGRDLEPWMNFGDLSRGEFGLAMGIKQSHWPLWPLFHTAADPDDKRIALVPLFLGLAACFNRLPERRRWIALIVVGYLLTLGPYLKGTGKMPFRIALPYLFLYDWFPFFERFWWPQRLELLVLVGLLVMGALQLERWSIYLPRWGQRFAWIAILGCWLDIPFRNPYFPVEAQPPRSFNSELYEAIDGPIITTPVLSSNEITRHVLWLQTFHELPILGGLGDHISSHRPRDFNAYVADRELLYQLAMLSKGQFQSAKIEPADVDALLDDGFRWVVVDPSAYSPGLEERWAEAFTAFCQNVWGTPSKQVGSARAWRISAIPAPVWIEGIEPVEHSGPRTEEQFIDQSQLPPGQGRGERMGAQPPVDGMIPPPPGAVPSNR